MPVTTRRPGPRRIRKMPHHLRCTRGIYQVQLSVPGPLQEAVARITGRRKPAQAWLIRSTGTGNLREAERRRDDEIMPEFRRILRAAESRCDPVMLAAGWINPKIITVDAAASAEARKIALLGLDYSGVPAEQEDLVRALLNGHFDRQDKHIERLDGLANEIRHTWPRPLPDEKWADIRASIIGAARDPTPNGDPITTDVVMALWQSDRELPPKPKAVRAKERKLERLFAFLGKPDNLAGVTVHDLQGYKEHLVREGGNNYARDHLIDLKSIFTVAYNNQKITANPAAQIKVPGKRAKVERVPFSDDEAREILIAARNAGPIVRWANWLAAFSGMITEEIVDADTRDVEVISGIPCFHVRPYYRAINGAAGEDALKTKYRTRILPLHPAIADEFVAFVAGVRADYHGGGHGPLFPMLSPDRDGLRNTKASNEIMKFIRGLGITEKEKVFYSWRHRVASQLEHMQPRPGRDTQRYIIGHGPIDVHARFYLDHPPRDLKPFIDRLPDPTAT